MLNGASEWGSHDLAILVPEVLAFKLKKHMTLHTLDVNLDSPST
jgi:hypothetical protein